MLIACSAFPWASGDFSPCLDERGAVRFPVLQFVESAGRGADGLHNELAWDAVAWIDGKTYTTPTCELDVLGRRQELREGRLGEDSAVDQNAAEHCGGKKF